jgi:hypothetical protein
MVLDKTTIGGETILLLKKVMEILLSNLQKEVLFQ